MNFKNNIERCMTAQSMGYRVQLLRNDGWHTNECIFILPATQYRVHPDDVEAFEADLAAREDAAMRRSPTPNHTEVDATSVETPGDSLEVLAKLLPLLGSLPGVSADITVTLHIKV